MVLGLGETGLDLPNQFGKTKGRDISASQRAHHHLPAAPEPPSGQTCPGPLLPFSLPKEEMRHAGQATVPSPPWEMERGAQILLGQDSGNKGSRAVKVWAWGGREWAS